MSDRRLQSHVACVATCVLLVSLLFGQGALAQSDERNPGGSPETVPHLQGELDAARASLDRVAANESDLEIAAVEAREKLATADRAVAAAAQRLILAQDQQATADEAAAGAAERLVTAEIDLADAEVEVADTEEELAALRVQLTARARTAYMQGSAFGVVEMLLNIQDYDDISRVQLLVAEVIEHDDELVNEWLRLQELRQDQLNAAVGRRTEVATAKKATDLAAARARDAADAAAEASREAVAEQGRRASVLESARVALTGLNQQRLSAEETIEALEATIAAERAAARASVQEAERIAAAEIEAQATIERAQAAPETTIEVSNEEGATSSSPGSSSTSGTTSGAPPTVIEPAPQPAPQPAPKPVQAPAPNPAPPPAPKPVQAPAPNPAPPRPPPPPAPPPPPSTSGQLCSSSSGWVWPTAGCVKSGYGLRTSPTAGASSFHRGIDIPAPGGQDIRAVAGGRVWRANLSSSHGNVVVINHGGGLYSLYAHQNRMPPVRVGQWVSAGQVIGSVGSTGISTGNHLHFEVHLGCMYSCSKVDPAPYFR